jgi:competence protein ComFC
MNKKKNFRLRLSDIAHSIGNNAIDLVFPRICIVCRGKLTLDKWLCDSCLELLWNNNMKRDACPLCGQNRIFRKCTCEYNRQEPFESAFSIFDFDDTVKSIVHQFKYDGKKNLAYDMGKKYAGLIPDSFFEGMDAVVCVPLFFVRQMRRGYNQAEYFAKGIVHGRSSIDYIPNVIVRKRHTGTQTKLSRTRRVKNVEGAFMIFNGKKKLLQNKNMIIVDDVITTAATVGECAKILLEAGCGKVRVLSLARD